ncbi:MAG: restriction endonuclease subunit S [Polyangiaceae bacterium]|nr:restriction endonuclease subunit S [Polyangiaceae bacterium]
MRTNLVSPGNFLDLPHVAPDNIEKGTGRLLGYRSVREDAVTSSKHRFFPGQILYSKIRPNLSKVVVIDFEGLCSADMYPLNPRIEREYLQLFLLSAAFLEQVVREDNRLAMPKVNQAQLSATRIAVPPLAEQKRIVARVEHLMKLCDDLEAKLRRAEDRASKLVEAVVQELVA